jgi:hypothetical protein
MLPPIWDGEIIGRVSILNEIINNDSISYLLIYSAHGNPPTTNLDRPDQ